MALESLILQASGENFFPARGPRAAVKSAERKMTEASLYQVGRRHLRDGRGIGADFAELVSTSGRTELVQRRGHEGKPRGAYLLRHFQRAHARDDARSAPGFRLGQSLLEMPGRHVQRPRPLQTR